MADMALVRFSAEVEQWLRPLLPSRIRLETRRAPFGLAFCAVDEKAAILADLHQPEDQSYQQAHALRDANIIAQAALYFEVERERSAHG